MDEPPPKALWALLGLLGFSILFLTGVLLFAFQALHPALNVGIFLAILILIRLFSSLLVTLNEMRRRALGAPKHPVEPPAGGATPEDAPAEPSESAEDETDSAKD